MSLQDVVRRWRIYRETGKLPYPILSYRKRMAEEELARAISEALDLREHLDKVKPAPARPGANCGDG